MYVHKQQFLEKKGPRGALVSGVSLERVDVSQYACETHILNLRTQTITIISNFHGLELR
jgi:hypothetical protein